MKEVIVRLTDDHIKVKGGEYVQDLVRCKDCAWRNTERCIIHFFKEDLKDADYCSFGEVRDE